MSPWVEISTGGILALLIIDKAFSFVKYRNGNGNITVQEFRSNINAFREHHEHEQETTTALLVNNVAQTEILRELKSNQVTILRGYETDQRKVLEALQMLIITMQSMARVLDKLEAK